ncbi:MAG: hypothetical protein K2K97_09445 [Muribaculaceae bacterium]|nr:hypothetical protein [Muribaculaceae bacterium]
MKSTTNSPDLHLTMRKIILALIAVISFMAHSESKIVLKVADRTMTATLVENDATRELCALLASGPITIQMSDYGGFEKVGELPQSFPTSNTQITTEPGDIMLYQGNNMVIFYGSNSWSYTRLGKIDGATADNVRQFLGNGNIALTISLDTNTGIKEVTATDHVKNVYDLNGNPINSRPLTPGLYIIDGVKTLITN